MNKDKALESVNEIKELMEKSSKFISLSGLAAIMAGIYALVGAYIATQVITPDTHLIVALELMAIIASLVLVAAAVTACILSYYKSKKTGQNFQPPHLPGIVEFLSSDADRRCFMYFHPYTRVL